MNRVKMIVGVTLSCAAIALVWTLIGGCNRAGAPVDEETAAEPGGDFIPGETLPEQSQSRHVAEGGAAALPPGGASLPEPTPAPAAVAPAEAAAAPAAPAAADETYTVKKGDTLTAISRRLGIPVKTLIEANSISDPRKISIGQKLIVPSHPGK
jgi:LysM repeat protein